MGLAHPALTTSGKKKGKQKFKSSEDKQRAEQLEKEWKELKSKYEPRKPISKSTEWTYRLSTPAGRTTSHHIPSRGDGLGVAGTKESLQYSGTEMIGISLIHKSCLQPVFSKESAVEVASMRR